MSGMREQVLFEIGQTELWATTYGSPKVERLCNAMRALIRELDDAQEDATLSCPQCELEPEVPWEPQFTPTLAALRGQP